MVVLAVIGGVVAAFLLPDRQTPPTSPATTDEVATYLLQPEDLVDVKPDTTWTVSSTDTTVGPDTPQSACLLAAADTQPAPASTLVRTLSPSSGDAGILHEVDLYATTEEAASAYAARVTQLAACERETAWAQSGASVTGLSDASTAMTYVIQDAESEYHTFVLSQSGTRVNIVDATQPSKALPVDDLTGALTSVSTRQCSVDGTCPTDVATSSTLPLTVDPAGWLAAVDLPRINAGTGTWRGTDVTEMNVVGSRCEAIDFADVAKQQSAAQRTYLLADDADIPAEFGVDEVVYTFANADDAKAILTKLKKNMGDCADRVPTATVKKVANLKGVGTGTTWTVDQRTDTSTAHFRVTVLQVKDKIVYLMANPSADADFTDGEWKSVSTRAAGRATQG